ncbi:hypothetical protein BDQ17DRAFT_1339372 [Cyathus striatus]|nr:hypothetical protein BDQ17DRAFT_1339372 [Cyathus striatus]
MDALLSRTQHSVGHTARSRRARRKRHHLPSSLRCLHGNEKVRISLGLRSVSLKSDGRREEKLMEIISKTKTIETKLMLGKWFGYGVLNGEAQHPTVNHISIKQERSHILYEKANYVRGRKRWKTNEWNVDEEELKTTRDNETYLEAWGWLEVDAGSG